MKILGPKTIRITLNFSYCTFIWKKNLNLFQFSHPKWMGGVKDYQNKRKLV